MTFEDFWVGISKKRGIDFFCSGGGAFMAAWLSGETGARHKFGQFCSGVFEKEQHLKNLFA